MSEQPTCETCRWWDKKADAGFSGEDDMNGFCCLKPPTVQAVVLPAQVGNGLRVQERYHWPVTEPRNFCGEYQPKEGER